jgi:hypothetical protein
MISPFQIQANRRNALRSTGPKTEEGKQRSRENSLRHGLTAETIVASLEDAEDYKAFEAVIVSDYCAETAVARELVLRLASVLWRLRRATSIETQLLEMQAEVSWTNHLGTETEQLGIQQELFRSNIQGLRDKGFTRATLRSCQTEQSAATLRLNSREVWASDYGYAARQLANCFLRLAELDVAVLERLSRYEARLWRQALQIICVLDPIRPR